MKNKLFLSLLLLLTFACSKKDNENMPADGYDRVYPLLVVNEGKYILNNGVGSVCRYTNTTTEFLGGIYGGEENNGMGGSTSFATLWQDTLYVVSKDNNLGDVLSAYNNKTGEFLKGYKTENGVQGSSFAVINNKIGILSTAGDGAVVIDMSTFTKKGTLNGTSSYTGDMIVYNNFFYLIDNQERILVYPLASIETAIPTVIEEAIGGFTVGQDRTLWAYNNESTYDFENWAPVESTNSSLIKINTSTGQEISRLTLNIPILKSFTAYYPGLLKASTAQNVLFFTKSAEVSSPILYKYAINEGVTENLYTLTNNESFKNIVYNPSNNSVSAIVYKSDDYSGKYSILTLDATNGKLKQRHDCYNNPDAQKYGAYLLLLTK